MRSIDETFETFGKRVLWLGYAGEEDRSTLIVDLHDILLEFPGATAILKVRPPDEKAAYPAITETIDDKLCWSISDSDTAKEGRGELQLSLISPTGSKIKTAVAAMEISRSLPDGGQKPDRIDDWMENAEVARKKAEEAASNADTKANLANDAATKANEATSKANTAASNADAKANLANDAATKANEATSKANTAASNADAKANLANDAATKADTATNNANTATTEANEAATKATDAAKRAEDAAEKADKACQNILIGSETGNPVSVSDVFSAPLCGLTVYGKSTQDGTPSPDNPVPIVSAGDGGSVAVKVTGKNLLYIPDGVKTVRGVTITSKNGRISISGTATENGYVYLPVKQISIHGLALLSSNVSDPVAKLVSESWEVLFVQGKANATQGVITRVCFIVKEGTNYDSDGINVQLEFGTTATAYSPYHEQLLTLPTPNGLRGIPVASGGNYTDKNGQQWICDEVDLERGIYIKRVAVTVLTVDMIQTFSSSTNDYCIMIRPPTDYKYTAGIRIVLMSNRFRYEKYIKNKGVIFGYNNQIRLYVDPNEIKTLDAAKEFIKKNQIEIMYEVNEHVETPLTPAEIAAYKALTTYAPNTVVQASDGAGLKLDYQRDVNIVIKNLEDAIASMTTT